MENKVLKLGGGEIYPRCICRNKNRETLRDGQYNLKSVSM